jgi:integrase
MSYANLVLHRHSLLHTRCESLGMRLTDIAIKALKMPESGQVTYTDDALPDFGVRVSRSGTKTFVLVHGTSRQRKTIRCYPVISLQEARSEAKKLLAERALGKRDLLPITFEEAVVLFLATHYLQNSLKPRTKVETERLLRVHFLLTLRYEKLTDISPQVVSKIIDRRRKTTSVARHAFSAIRLFFGWATSRGYITHGPCTNLRAPPAVRPRDSVLTEEELRTVLHLARSEDSSFNMIVQILALTGQRRAEIASLRAEWIDFNKRTITLPPEITKNKHQFTFPFGATTESLLKKGNPKGLLFSALGKNTPANGWSKLKLAFDRKCQIARSTLHDLRRTFATNLAALGVPVHVTEKLLNHVSGTMGGIAAVYQRYAYQDEMRDGIERWDKYLCNLMSQTDMGTT